MLALKQIFSNVRIKKSNEEKLKKSQNYQKRKSIFDKIGKYKEQRKEEKRAREKEKSKKSSLVLDATFQTLVKSVVTSAILKYWYGLVKVKITNILLSKADGILLVSYASSIFYF